MSITTISNSAQIFRNIRATSITSPSYKSRPLTSPLLLGSRVLRRPYSFSNPPMFVLGITSAPTAEILGRPPTIGANVPDSSMNICKVSSLRASASTKVARQGRVDRATDRFRGGLTTNPSGPKGGPNIRTHESPDPERTLLEERRGDIAVLAGRNRPKLGACYSSPPPAPNVCSNHSTLSYLPALKRQEEQQPDKASGHLPSPRVYRPYP